MYSSLRNASSLLRTYQTSCVPKTTFKALSSQPFTQLAWTRPSTRLNSSAYDCGIDAEPLDRYRVGGYHPVALGDRYKDGRYKVLHKLGWGGHSTVWAAKDLQTEEYVALKVSVADSHEKSHRELKVLTALAELDSGDVGSGHIMALLDDFHIEGPNGKHQCLVLEFMGPNVPNTLDEHFQSERLPGPLAKASVQQALTGLAYLHEHNIGHGDLHASNLNFAIPCLHRLTEEELIQKLDGPKIGAVTRKDGKPLEPGMPAHLVSPASLPLDTSLSHSQQMIKIIDFGESFFNNEVPESLHTAIHVRAPEIIFGDALDKRVDLWSAGCMIYELIAGKPLIHPSSVEAPVPFVSDMLAFTSDEVPERWLQKWQTMTSAWTRKNNESYVQSWLEDAYYHQGHKTKALTQEDLVKVGALVNSLLRFEPSKRASAQEILQDPWFTQK